MNKRKIHLEILRIFAIILVVFNHTPAFHFPFSSQGDISWTEFLMLNISIADKVAVPLFFMISGALLFVKKEELTVLLKKRVLRMLAVLILFLPAQNSIFYFFGHLTLKQAAFNIIAGRTPAEATWFLYGYLAFLLMLPLLRLLVEKMETQHFLYLIALHFITVEFIPTSHTPLDTWLPFTVHFGAISNIYLYAIIGYYLEHRLSFQVVSKRILCMLAVASVTAILIGATLTLLPSIMWGHTPAQTYSCFTGSVLIPCIFIYLAAKRLAGLSCPTWLTHLITLLGSASFTIMLTENIFRKVLSAHIQGYSTQYAASVGITLMVCCCGWLCGIIAKRVPWIKHLV